MRPVLLTMSAFGSYAGITHIDFTKFDKCSLYLIAGKTGSGKTTIFDAITFALYGKASGSVRDNAKRFRSNYANPNEETYVKLIFENKGVMYEVVRNPEYMREPKKGDKDKLIKQSANATLRYVDGDIISTDVKKVTAKITEIIGVDAKQFTQMAVLAQGEFQKLLIASSEEREKIFRELFHTENYDSIQKRIKDDFNQAEKERNELQISIDNDIESITTDNPKFFDEQNRIKNQKLKEANDAIDLLDEMIKEDEYNQDEFNKQKLTKQKELEYVQEQIKLGQQINKDFADLNNKKNTLKEILKKCEQAMANVEASKKYEAKLEEKKQQRGIINDKLASYDELDECKSNISSIAKKLEASSNEIAASTKNIELQKENVVRYMEKYNKLAELINNKNNIDTRLSDIVRRKSDLELLVDKKEQYIKKLSQYKTSTYAYEEAKKKAILWDAQYNQLNEAFLDAQAGILARDVLKPNLPCPVCGSKEHPSIAHYSEAAPTKEEVENARELRDKGQKDFADKSEKASRIKGECDTMKTEVVSSMKNLFSIDDIDKLEDLLSNEMVKVSGDFYSLSAQSNKLDLEITNSNKAKEKADSAQKEIEALSQFVEEKKLLFAELSESKAKETAKSDTLKKNLLYESKGEAINEIASLTKSITDIEKVIAKANEDLAEVKEERSVLEGSIKQIEESLKDKEVKDISLFVAKEKNIKDDIEMIEKSLEKLHKEHGVNTLLKQNIEKNWRLLSENRTRYGWLKELKDTVNGTLSGKEKIKLEVFAQMEYFNRILDRANEKFEDMTSGQYTMIRTKEAESNTSQFGLDISVIDHFNGSVRSVRTLSGGESFKASLSLALGLADEVTANSGGIRLDSLFVDEGFGSLSEDDLEQALNMLNGLTDGNRQVGIISHVPVLKERIDNQIIVEKDINGCSSISYIGG